jgi:hypothetical protein
MRQHVTVGWWGGGVGRMWGAGVGQGGASCCASQAQLRLLSTVWTTNNVGGRAGWNCTYGSVGSLEATNLLLSGGELLRRYDWLQDLENKVPELVVVLVEQNNEAGALGVERRGDVQQRLLSKLGDLLIGQRRCLVELVVGAARLDGLEEGAARHGAGVSGGWEVVREEWECFASQERRRY